MRKLHYNVSRYSEPFDVIKYTIDFINGVRIEKKNIVIKNCYGSMMWTDKLTVSNNNSRSLSTDISLITQNPPFRFDDSYRIIINANQYIISSINYNLLTRGEIQLLLKFEKPFRDENDKN